MKVEDGGEGRDRAKKKCKINNFTKNTLKIYMDIFMLLYKITYTGWAKIGLQV